MLGKKLLTISTSTSSPPCPKIDSGSCPALVKTIRPSMPINTAALSVIKVNKIATQRPLSISSVFFTEMKRTYTCGEPKKPSPIMANPKRVAMFSQGSSEVPQAEVNAGSIACKLWVIFVPSGR